MRIDPVALTGDLIDVPSVSGTPGEGIVLDLLAERLADRFEIRSTRDDRGLRAVAAVPRDADAPLLVMSGHVDVVPVGDPGSWQRDPFSAQVDGDRMYGRGGSDMKAGLAAIAAALLSAPAGSAVAAVFTVEEETGSLGAADAGSLLEGRPVDALLIAEPTDGRLLRGHKGVTWVRAHTDGIAAHGSTPHLGTNAVTRLARVLVEAESVDGPWETMNVGMLSGGSAVNIVPATAAADIDMRTTAVGSDPGAWWRSHPDVQRVDTLLDLSPVFLDPADALVAALDLEVDGRIAGYFTDASVLVDTLQCDRLLLWGPGAMDQAHRLDEWVSVDSILRTTTSFIDLVHRWSIR
jgi:succinyl-diaminopimelate desuccinylase